MYIVTSVECKPSTYDVRVTDGWIDNVNCCITLQLREIKVEEDYS